MQAVSPEPGSPPSAQLVIISPGTARTKLPLANGSNVIGRRVASDSKDVAIRLPGLNVSRRHAELKVGPSGNCELVDLDSKNGTYVNGLRVNTSTLESGDVVSIGNYKLMFVVSSGDSAEASGLKDQRAAEPDQPTHAIVKPTTVVELADYASSLDMGKTVFRPVEDVMAPIVGETPIDAGEKIIEDSARISQITRKTQMLSILYQASKALISATSLNDLLDKVMDLVFEKVKAERGVMILVDGKTGGWTTEKVRYTNGVKADEKIVLSKSIASMALTEKKSVLINDALLDPGLMKQESVKLLGIRSAMCVPLTHLDNVLGLIYLDTSSDSERFTQDDLDIITALGNHAAIAINQAQLNDRIRQQEAFRRKMERYHSPAVIDRILQGPENALDVHEADVTVLFADITDFTVFCEKHSPAVVRNMLNEYFGEMTEVIFKHEGTLDKYIADEILAVFGVPFAHGDDAERALLTALEMQEALERLNSRRPPEMRFRVKIGINTGHVLVGDIGCMRRMDYTVLGDPVNTAKRIQTSAQPNQILVGSSTYEQVSRDKFRLLPRKAIQLKGKSGPIQLYELQGIA